MITMANPVRPPSELHYKSSKGNKIVLANNLDIRVLTEEEVRERGCYDDMLELASIFNHEIVEDGKIWRWRCNLFVDWIQDHAPFYSPSAAESCADGDRGCAGSRNYRGSLSLNDLVIDLDNGMFTMEEWMKFYMQMGYSLCGFSEVFGQHEAAEYGLPGAKEPQNQAGYTENVIDYMIRVHKGKVLKL